MGTGGYSGAPPAHHRHNAAMTDTATPRHPETGRRSETWQLSAVPDDSPVATALFREYYSEVAARYHVVHGFPPITPEEIDEGLAEYPVGQFVRRAANCSSCGRAGRPPGAAGCCSSTAGVRRS